MFVLTKGQINIFHSKWMGTYLFSFGNDLFMRKSLFKNSAIHT